jgi:carboxypeptidase Q
MKSHNYLKHFFTFSGIICLIFMTTLGYSQTNKVVKNIIEIGKTDNQTMKHLDVLCNRFGGRLLGSDTYDNAADWCASQFLKWGMKVETPEVGTLPVGFNRGPWFGRLMSDNGMILHFATPSYTAGTKGIQKGHVVLEPKSQVEFDRMKGRLKGAWVLITGDNVGWPIDFSKAADKHRDSIIAENIEIAKKNGEIIAVNKKNGENAEQLKYLVAKDEPALFYKQLKEAGILGIIQSAPLPIRVLYDRKNVDSMTFENLPTIPDIKLDEHQYKIIEQMAKERQRFELEFDIRNYFRMGPVKYHSVSGVIPGTEFPNEYVIVSGHLDCFDVAAGGVDDGSGASPTMEAARLIMKAGGKPKRTMLFCLFAGEEFGLYGSTDWVKENPGKLSKIANMFNRDGGPLVPDSLSVSDAMFDDMKKICEPINSINPDFPFYVTHRVATPKPVGRGSTDSSPFGKAGVPIMTFHLSDSKGYDFNYGEIWHTERDLYNKSIPEYQEHSSIVTAIVAYGVANLDHLLSREGYYAPDITEPVKK